MRSTRSEPNGRARVVGCLRATLQGFERCEQLPEHRQMGRDKVQAKPVAVAHVSWLVQADVVLVTGDREEVCGFQLPCGVDPAFHCELLLGSSATAPRSEVYRSGISLRSPGA